jgi:hypothetical protein
MLIAIDLSRVYFAVRDLKLRLDYEKLFDLLVGDTPKEEVTIYAFTVANPDNKKQRKFLERLRELGVHVVTYSFKTRPSFSEELSAIAGECLSHGETVTLVSNDRALMRVFDLLDAYAPRMTLCFFSDKLEAGWAQKILKEKTNFTDLSSKENLERLQLQPAQGEKVQNG